MVMIVPVTTAGEKAQHVFHERRDAEAENAANQNRAVNAGQSDARHRRHGQHG
jgi:hypothetical protein